MQLSKAFSLVSTTLAALSMVTSAHNVRQAHRDLDMLIQSCEWLKKDAGCITTETAEIDGVEIVFDLCQHNNIVNFVGTKRVPKTEPYAPDDEKAVNAKIEQYKQCMRVVFEEELPRILKIAGMEQYVTEIDEQLIRYKEEEARCLIADVQVTINVDIQV